MGKDQGLAVSLCLHQSAQGVTGELWGNCSRSRSPCAGSFVRESGKGNGKLAPRQHIGTTRSLPTCHFQQHADTPRIQNNTVWHTWEAYAHVLSYPRHPGLLDSPELRAKSVVGAGAEKCFYLPVRLSDHPKTWRSSAEQGSTDTKMEPPWLFLLCLHTVVCRLTSKSKNRRSGAAG